MDTETKNSSSFAWAFFVCAPGERHLRVFRLDSNSGAMSSFLSRKKTSELRPAFL